MEMLHEYPFVCDAKISGQADWHIGRHFADWHTDSDMSRQLFNNCVLDEATLMQANLQVHQLVSGPDRPLLPRSQRIWLRRRLSHENEMKVRPKCHPIAGIKSKIMKECQDRKSFRKAKLSWIAAQPITDYRQPLVTLAKWALACN